MLSHTHTPPSQSRAKKPISTTQGYIKCRVSLNALDGTGRSFGDNSFFKRQHLQTLSLFDVFHQLLLSAVSSAEAWRPQAVAAVPYV